MQLAAVARELLCKAGKRNHNLIGLPSYAGREVTHGRYPIVMLCRAYIEALLADEQLADQVHEAYARGAISKRCAYQAWCLIAFATRLGVTVSLDIRPFRRPF